MTTNNNNNETNKVYYAYTKGLFGVYSLYRFKSETTRDKIIDWKNTRGYKTQACDSETAQNIADKISALHGVVCGWRYDVTMSGKRLPYQSYTAC